MPLEPNQIINMQAAYSQQILEFIDAEKKVWTAQDSLVAAKEWGALNYTDNNKDLYISFITEQQDWIIEETQKIAQQKISPVQNQETSSLTADQVKILRTHYTPKVDRLVASRLQQKQTQGKALTWDENDSRRLFLKFAGKKNVKIAEKVYNAEKKWIDEITNKAAQQKIQELNASPILRKIPVQLAKKVVSSPVMTSPPSAPANHIFKAELDKLDVHIKELQELERQGKLSGGKKFLGIKFKSNQAGQLEQAQDMRKILMNSNINTKDNLGILHSRIEGAIALNKSHTGALVSGGKLKTIYKEILSKIESSPKYVPELKDSSSVKRNTLKS